MMEQSVQWLSLCDPMDCSTPGFPVLHHLLELAQIHVHWVSDTIQPSHPLLPPSPFAFNPSQHWGLFQVSCLFTSGSQSIGTSASASVLSMNIQGWFPLGLTCLISFLSKGQEIVSKQFESIQETVSKLFESISSSVLSLLYDPTLTFIHDYWKTHSFD